MNAREHKLLDEIAGDAVAAGLADQSPAPREEHSGPRHREGFYFGCLCSECDSTRLKIIAGRKEVEWRDVSVEERAAIRRAMR